VNIEKTARMLGWRPEMALSDGLRETYRWFVARRGEVRA
jgi:dTDP-D-glucose 4,6-dehydratase